MIYFILFFMFSSVSYYDLLFCVDFRWLIMICTSVLDDSNDKTYLTLCRFRIL